VTVVLIAGLLTNLLVIGRLDPPELDQHGDLPLAASCQGGGAGCAEQPLIPPPAVGLPRFDAPPPAVFGEPALVQIVAPVAVHEPPPDRLERPPIATVSV
jgi:hypothetical protein